MEARKTPLSAARWWAACSVPPWPRLSLFPRCLDCCMECASHTAIRRARKRRIPMAEIKHERTGASRLALLLGLVAAGALGLCIYFGIHGRLEAASSLQNATERAAVSDVGVVHPKATAPIDEVVLPGATQPFVNSPIYARTNGYLVKWFYDIGAKVKKGDLLAIIDTPELDKQLEQARADLASATSNLALSKITAERWQGLVKTRSVSQQSTDQAVDNLSATQASVDSYGANVRRLEDMVSFEKVYAPFDGVITVRNTDTGWLIDAGASSPSKQLFQLAQTSTLRIFVAVPEVYSRAARVGATATLTLDEFPGQIFRGRVTRTSQSIDMA